MIAGRLSPCLLALLRPIKNLIYPPLCFHCDGPLSPTQKLLCSTCFDLLTLLTSKNRCPRCFFPLTQNKCHTCVSEPIYLAAALSHEGPIVTLLHQLHQGQSPQLATALAPLYLLQWAHLQWPQPDYIVPIPQNLPTTLVFGKSSISLLAPAIAALFKAPLLPELKKEITDTFEWKGMLPTLRNKTLLMIDTSTNAPETFSSAARTLKQSGSRHIYGLSLTQLE